MSELLPLSWARTNTLNPVYRSLSLPLSGTRWVTYADLPGDYDFSSVGKDLEGLFPEGFLIRGCSRKTANSLEQQGGEVLRTGAEAVLYPQNGHFEKKSLCKLLQQAGKKGRIAEIPLDDVNRERLRELQQKARHGTKPQLSHVFRTYPFEGCRCFVVLSDKQEWYAAVTLSIRDELVAHTELLLKHVQSPPGIMEFLLAGVFQVLCKEGFREWSLGEVPFYHLDREKNIRMEERMMALAAGLCRKVYDFNGLFYFKNKFGPEWRDVYLFSNRGISLLTFADLAIQSRYSDLLARRLLDDFMKFFF